MEFPKTLAGRSIKDPEMLQWWRALGVMLLTSDSSMVDDHTRFLPNTHKGIVVICNGGRPSLGHEQIMELLTVYKHNLPQWETLDLQNAVIELWYAHPAQDICVLRVRNGEVEWQEAFSYSAPNWQPQFLDAITRAGS